MCIRDSRKGRAKGSGGVPMLSPVLSTFAKLYVRRKQRKKQKSIHVQCRLQLILLLLRPLLLLDRCCFRYCLCGCCLLAAAAARWVLLTSRCCRLLAIAAACCNFSYLLAGTLRQGLPRRQDGGAFAILCKRHCFRSFTHNTAHAWL